MVLYYRRYVADFMAGTAHLSPLEVGIYTLLLDWQYSKELPLPERKSYTARVAKCSTPHQRKVMDIIVDEFFPEARDACPPGRWNTRAYQELTAARAAIEKMRQAGHKGAAGRWGTPYPTPSKPDGVAMDPSSIIPQPKKKKKKDHTYTPEFESVWAAYPKRGGANPKRRAFLVWRTRCRDGADPDDILAGVQRYAAFCEATDKVGTEYVMQAARFFGPDAHYREQWEIPRQSNGTGQQQLRIAAR